MEFDGVDNKDASVFPVAIPNPSGQLSMAMLQRPLFTGTRPEETSRRPASGLGDLDRESIWISYCSTAMAACEPFHLCHFGSHHRLAAPVAAWEQLKIGGGTPPILTRHGWLTIYHGVSELSASPPRKLCYSAGVLVLSEEFPQVIRFRSQEPVLIPELPQEREGIVANVVFPHRHRSARRSQADIIRLPQRMTIMNIVWPVTGLYFPLAGWWRSGRTEQSSAPAVPRFLCSIAR